MKRKHTMIVGGTRGIGCALVKALVEEGHLISVIGRQPPSELDSNTNVHYWTLDLSHGDDISKVLTEIIKQNGKLKNLVFFQRYRGKGDDWTGEIKVSLTATKKIIELLADKFDGGDGNSIVIVSSIAAYFITEEQPLSYHTAKAGLNQMVRYYASALGSKGIRVNCVSPSTVLKDESKEFYFKNKELHNLYKRITPLGRMGTSEDIANAVAFLCSQKASFITGQNLIVDGGVSLQGHESLARKLTSLSNLNITRRK